VVVRVAYAGLSPGDLHQRNGRYSHLPGRPAGIAGMEVAGVVERCGERAEIWQPGDRVFGFVGGGGLADRVLAGERLLARIPDGLAEREAASVPSSFISAHDALCTQAGLQAGETLLVHGAGGGFGSAAIQLGRAFGARVLGVVRSDAAAEAAESLGAEVVRDEGFVAAVLERTGGRGVDVIAEVVGAPHFPGNVEALAPKGRIVVLGVGGGDRAEVPLALLMQKRAVLRGTTLRSRPPDEQALAVAAFERDVVPLLADGRVRAIVDSVYPASEAAAAFDRLAASGKIGNVLIEFEP
jgi:NADPH2:quinone reductase